MYEIESWKGAQNAYPETHETLIIGEDGVCNVCKAQDDKDNINWEKRLDDLDMMIEKYKGVGNYDCIVPFSGERQYMDFIVSKKKVSRSKASGGEIQSRFSEK